MVIFAPQNVVMEPPFTKLDVLFCRNLLIYLSPGLQPRLMPLFHYSLNPGGVLLLGSSETVGSNLPHRSKSAPLKGKFPALPTDGLLATPSTPAGRVNPPYLPVRHTAERRMASKPAGNLQPMAEHFILPAHSPPAVVVNDKATSSSSAGRPENTRSPRPAKPI